MLGESDRRTFLKLGGATGAAALLNTGMAGRVEAFAQFAQNLDSQLGNNPADVVSDSGVVLNSSFLMYHEMSYPKLKSDILSLIRRGQQPISPDTAVNVLNGVTEIPPGLQTFMVTCDDSLASQYDSVLRATEEIANETGWFVPVTFCAITKLDDPTIPIEELPDNTPMYNDGRHRYLTLGQVINLIQAGHILANHTVDHAVLPNLPDGARNAEVEVAEQRINTIYDIAQVARPAKIIAYPLGRYTGELSYIDQLGFDLGLSTIPTTRHTTQTRLYAGRIKMS